MPLVRVKPSEVTGYQKQKVIRDLFWHDPEKKKLLKYQGTRLEYNFEYDESLEEPKYRLLPKVVIAEERVKVTGKDIKNVERWFKDYTNYNDSEAKAMRSTINKNSITYDVPDDELDQFIDNLDRNLLTYEIM